MRIVPDPPAGVLALFKGISIIIPGGGLPRNICNSILINKKGF